ncbi:response regulator [Mucilaginibacter ginkgonis]|uniref:response regulator n=1 Tax=Mucilaginibacter ginkgonis TaxID=2682091 RepID=UPI0012FCBC7F|nr:response regulator [Mucilaginibacter ginkgonis]
MNGQVALDMLTQSVPFTMILLNLEMRVLDGYQTMAYLSEHNYDVPVLAFTSLVDHQMY